MIASKSEAISEKEHTNPLVAVRSEIPDEAVWRASFAIGGMTCQSCVETVRQAVSAPYVKNVHVSLITGSAVVEVSCIYFASFVFKGTSSFKVDVE